MPKQDSENQNEQKMTSGLWVLLIFVILFILIIILEIIVR
jgi:cytochrome c1